MEESGSPVGGEASSPVQAVYTDVDGTLTAYNTIFDFLRFDAARQSRSAEAEEFLAALRTAAGNGVPRSVTNARYFGWWQGRRVAEIEKVGEAWADRQASAPEDWPFLEPVASLLDSHQTTGHRLVAVTASFAPALVHVRRRWPHLELLCTSPFVSQTAEGPVYTGVVAEPLVGEAKARAVRAHAAEHSVDLAASFAYGDHSSDLQFMALAGKSLLVGAAVSVG